MTRPAGRPTASPPISARLLHVDNLRTALTALVVVHHSAIGYSNIPSWYYVEPPTDPSATLLDVLLLLNQSFFMGAFFGISALFVPASYDRKGPRRFLTDRLLRLGVPLVLWLLVIGPLVTVDDGRFSFSLNPGPMWFVEVLLVFSVLYVLWRYLLGRRPADGGRHASRPVPPAGRAPGAAAIVGFTLGLALVTYLWRIVVPMGTSVLGLPSPGHLPQYAALFAVGLVAARRGWLAGLSGPAGRIGFATAGVAAVAIVLVLVTTGEAILGHGTWPSLAMAVCEQALAVGVTVGLLVLFREHLDRQGPRRRFLSAHAFAVYVVHPLVLVALGHALSGVQAPAVAKFALLTVLAMPLCWLLAYLVRALPGARRVL